MDAISETDLRASSASWTDGLVYATRFLLRHVSNHAALDDLNSECFFTTSARLQHALKIPTSALTRTRASTLMPISSDCLIPPGAHPEDDKGTRRRFIFVPCTRAASVGGHFNLDTLHETCPDQSGPVAHRTSFALRDCALRGVARRAPSAAFPPSGSSCPRSVPPPTAASAQAAPRSLSTTPPRHRHSTPHVFPMTSTAVWAASARGSRLWSQGEGTGAGASARRAGRRAAPRETARCASTGQVAWAHARRGNPGVCSGAL